MELLVLFLAAVPVFLIHTKLGSGFFKLVKAILIWFVVASLGGVLLVSIQDKNQAVEQKANLVKEKIYLKNITTGIQPTEISELEYLVKMKTIDTVNAKILGETRTVTLYKNELNLITKVQISGDDFANKIIEIKNAIEARISKDNNKEVKLVCTEVNEHLYKNFTKICSVSNSEQTLTLKYVKTKPDEYVNNFHWDIELEDTNLLKIQHEKKMEELGKKREDDKKKMQSQI
jgi:hypothetical protein